MWFPNCGNHLESTRLHYVTFISSELYPAVLPAGAVELDLGQLVRSDALAPESFPLNKHSDKTFFRTKSHILWQGTPSTNQGKRNTHTSSHQLKIKNLYTEGCLRRCEHSAGVWKRIGPHLHWASTTTIGHCEFDLVTMSELAKLTSGATLVPPFQSVFVFVFASCCQPKTGFEGQGIPQWMRNQIYGFKEQTCEVGHFVN